MGKIDPVSGGGNEVPYNFADRLVLTEGAALGPLVNLRDGNTRGEFVISLGLGAVVDSRKNQNFWEDYWLLSNTTMAISADSSIKFYGNSVSSASLAGKVSYGTCYLGGGVFAGKEWDLSDDTGNILLGAEIAFITLGIGIAIPLPRVRYEILPGEKQHSILIAAGTTF